MRVFFYFFLRGYFWSFILAMAGLMTVGLFIEIHLETMLCTSAGVGLWFGLVAGGVFWVLEKDNI